jgi:AsmA protein
MKKLIKYSLIFAVVLIILVVAGVIAAPYLLNIDALLAVGEEKASSRLGRDVNIEDVSFSWIGPKIRLEGFSIAEAEGFGSEPFARFQSLDLKLRLLDLFRLRLSAEYVILTGPRIRIVRNMAGSFNFDDIIERLNAPAASALAPFAAMAPDKEGFNALPIDLLVKEIRMEDGELFFSDSTVPRFGRGITCKGAFLTLTDLSLDRPMRITAHLGINRLSRDLEFEGNVGPVGKPIVPGRIPFDLNLNLLPFELVRIPQIIGSLPVAPSGVITVRQRVRGSISEGVTFEADATLLKLNVENMEGKRLVKDFNGSLSQNGRMDLSSRRLSLSGLRLEAYQAIFEASGSVADLGPSPTLDFGISSNAIPLSGWDEVLPGLGPMVKLEGDLTFNGKLGGTLGKDLAADLSLSSKRFEMDRGPALLERSSSAAVTPPAGEEPIEPMKPLPITVVGTLTVDQGRFEKITFSDMETLVSQTGTLFSLDEMGMTVFSGRLSGKAWTDLGTLPLVYGANLAMSDVQVNDALASVAGLEGVLYSKISADISVDGKGTEFADIQKHLTGRGLIEGDEGRLTSANLAGGAAKAASLLGLGGENGETRFDDMNMAFTIENGKVKVSSMVIATKEWSMSTRGEIGLDQSLSLTSRMTLSQEATARIPEKRRRFFPKEPDGRVQIPLKIGGKVTSPKIGLDSTAMSEAAKEEVKQKVEERGEELKKKIQKDLGEKLKKLF